ncbi:MAG: HAD-IA family hydrolase [Saprospiraceae bacterium]
MHVIENIIFDLGGVIIDWDPKRLYRKIFKTEKEINYFLEHICTSDWNELQDEGRSLKEATEVLVNQHPQYQVEIEAFYGRWEEMLGGLINGTVDLAQQIHKKGDHKLWALTNWSAETFPIAEERYHIFDLFDGILVSGKEKLKKPDLKIYQLLLNRYHLDPENCLFIDDNLRNIKAAKSLGIHSHHFKNVENLRQALIEYKIL